MRLMTRSIVSASGGARLLETHVFADAAIEPLPGQISRAARDCGHCARLSGGLWCAEASAWHARSANGRRHRSIRIALLVGCQSGSDDARVHSAWRVALY